MNNNNGLERRRAGSVSDDARAIEAALARIGQEETETPDRSKRPGRLVFILDLTASRKPSLMRARIATAEMFLAVKRIGAVAVKLIYYRGDEVVAGAWESDPEAVSRTMRQLSCESGETQIVRALQLAVRGDKEPASGVVFIGDHCQDDPARLVDLAKAFGKRRTPIFVFHECADDNEDALDAKPIFKDLARLSGGAYCEFEPESAEALRELLASVAAFSAAGAEGVKNIPQVQTPEARQLQSRLLLLGPGSEK